MANLDKEYLLSLGTIDDERETVCAYAGDALFFSLFFITNFSVWINYIRLLR